jgi:hypothetical protein
VERARPWLNGRSSTAERGAERGKRSERMVVEKRERTRAEKETPEKDRVIVTYIKQRNFTLLRILTTSFI